MVGQRPYNTAKGARDAQADDHAGREAAAAAARRGDHSVNADNVLYSADRALQQLLQQPAIQQNMVLHAVARAFNWWGGPGVIWCAALLWLGARAFRRRRIARLGLRGAEAIAVASALNGILKGFAGRTRPFVTPGEPWHWDVAHAWTDAHYQSMPSGHTAATFAFAAAISVAASKWRPTPRAFLAAAVFTSAILVAFARMYLDQHWFTDVSAGALLGGVTGLVIARWHAAHPVSRFDGALLGPAARETL